MASAGFEWSNNTRLRLSVQGEPGEISLASLTRVLTESLRVLEELDGAISRTPKGSIEWVVDSLSTGSLVAEIAARPLDVDRLDLAGETASAVAARFVAGLREIQTEATVPPFFSESALRAVQRLSQTIRGNGAQAFQADDVTGGNSVTVTSETADAVRHTLRTGDESLGAIAGTLEMISIHRQPTVNIYESRTNKGVRSIVPKEPKERYEQLIDQIREALGKRVLAAGRVTRNLNGEPIRLRLESLEVLKDTALPSTGEFVASDPNFTGELTTEEYLRRLRES